MNPSEFKAWFEGFSENMGASPTKIQWKKIKEKVATITDNPTPWPLFVDRYMRPTPYQPMYDRWWSSAMSSLPSYTSNATTPIVAFAALGRQEALESMNS